LLRTYRLKLGLTQEGVAERAGLSVHAIQKLERGTTHPYRDTTNRLVDALGLSAEEEARFRELGQPAPRHQRDGASGFPEDVQLACPELPVALTSFVGREREIAEIDVLLESARLITLTGVGGCGKTRLALEVARQVSARFADGVVLVELASVAAAALVPQAVASTLGIREVPTQPLLATLGATLKSRQLLLVLDNCEHLLEASAQVADALLRASPRLTILATSRESLGLTGEVSWRVPSLQSPPVNALPSREEMAEFAAVRLFVDRAQAAQTHFSLTSRNSAAVAQICHQLDGIPLALELAAVRVRGMSVDELAARLDQRFRLLTGGSRTALPRQQTLRATIDWSYQLLTPEERLLFARLSVFASSWTLDAAEAVCGGRGIQRDDVVDLVLRLVDKSLVVPEEETDGAQRYGMLQTLRQYGREQLVATDEAATFHDLHATYFLALAERTDSARSGLDASGWTDRLALDQADFEAALDWLTAASDAERALRLAGVLWHLWQVHAYLTQGRRRIAALLELPAAEAPTLARARVLNGAGVLALNQLDTFSARRHFGESLRLYRDLQHDRGVAWVLIHLGWVCIDILYYKAADRFLREAVALCERLGERAGVARCLNLLGILAWERGNLREAFDLHRRSLSLSRELSDRWGAAWALHRLSVALLSMAELDQFEVSSVHPLIEEELAIWQALGERRHFAFGLCDLANEATLQRDFDRARRHLAEGFAIFTEVDDPHGVAWVLHGYGLLLAATGRPDAALRVEAAGRAAGGDLFQLRFERQRQHPFQLRYARQRKQICDTLGADAAARAWADGQTMSLPEAIVYAQRASAAAPAESALAD
jgi:predicted ATPase/DNA-binding XRE family transcriptional regulator